MKCLVTGISGFIGSNLATTLMDLGHSVIGIDKRCSLLRLPFADRMREMSIDKYSANRITRDYTFIWDDLNNLKSYGASHLEDIDIVYHLAANVSIREEEIDRNINDTVMGTFAVLDYISDFNIPKLVFSSTSSIYGDNAVGFITEKNGYIEPISHYAAGKVANEAYINSYAVKNPFKAWIFRFANVTGKNQNRGVIWDLVGKLKKDSKNLEILGNGKQRKSFFEVEDCVKGLIDIPSKNMNNNIEVYHLGNNEVITISKLAKIVCDEMGIKPKIRYTGGDRGWIGDTPHTEISIEKALSKGWKPTYTCEESIRRTIKWMLDNWNDINEEKIKIL